MFYLYLEHADINILGAWVDMSAMTIYALLWLHIWVTMIKKIVCFAVFCELENTFEKHT